MRERESPPSPTQYEACQGETEFQSTVASETVVQLERDSEKDAENYLSDDSDQSLEYCSSGDNSSDDSANVSSGAHEFVSKEVLSQSKRCSVCNNLRYRGWSATKLKPGWNCVFWTLEELEESARNGCQLCGIIREGVMRVVPTVKNPKYDELNELRYSIENTFFCPTWSDKYIRCGFHEVEFYTMPGEPNSCLLGFLNYVCANLDITAAMLLATLKVSILHYILRTTLLFDTIKSEHF